ncbi:uncharacterized protein LOC122670758 isoform X2 [Telopea speciosissima]|uniref:uncharacterized protein LOC122670758 isoform X2 n=1 Tax=Telopea speciosissima TaxID=54955 RepID=UPI001CC5013A|nr:uncharacterized protein LOC122670758 isoform X2 [Telopea speciosissima]
MPGNENADKIHNFFDQDNLSQGQHQLQITGGNWAVLNNNLWAGGQRPIGTPINSNSKNYSLQQSDSGNGNGRQSSRVQHGLDFTQLALRPEFAKGQSGNQQLNLNGFTHGQDSFQTRQHQAEFLGGRARGLSVLEPQQGNGPERSPGLTKNSERLETAEASSNTDFLGAQQLLMRGQQSGLPQPRPRQQSGFNDIPPWQQQLMIKQLQELQRQQQQQQQQQLQQLDQARQQSSINQLSSVAKQTAVDQLPALVNGIPVHDASNFFWPNEHIGGDSKVVPSSSQMFMVGGMNWVQRSGSPSVQGFPNGVMFSNEQGQALRSMGFVPQQLDQSLYGAPITSRRENLNQYSNVQGFSHDSADMLTKTGDNQVEKPLIQLSSLNNSFQGEHRVEFQDQVCMQDGASISKQGFQGKGLFENVPVQGLSGGVLSGNIQQLNSSPRNAHVQGFPGRQEQSGWAGNLQEKTMPQVGPSQGLVALDPTEERILFNSDDGLWDAPLSRSNNMGTGVYGNPLEGSDYFGPCPSIQSGSWSALMQSAVAEASSSDTGLQEEWSGLSFQKTELSTGNQPATFNDSGKGQSSWVDSNLQTVSSLPPRTFPLFDANMSPSSHNVPGFQQSGVKFPYEQSEKVRPDSSHESVQLSPKESGKWLDRSPQQKPHFEGSHQFLSPMHLENAPDGAWAGQIYKQSEAAAHSTNMDLNSQNIRGSWALHQNMSYKIGSHPCNKQNGWNINEALSPSEDATLKARENENSLQNSQSNDGKKAMQAEGDTNSGLWKADGNHVSMPFPNSASVLQQMKSGTGSPQVNSEDSRRNNFTALPDSSNIKSNQEINQKVAHGHPFDYGKHAIDSSVKYKGNESGGRYQHQLSNVPQVFESSLHNSERASGETYDKKQENSFQKEISNDSYNSSRSHDSVGVGGVRDNAWLNANDCNSLAGANQKSLGQVGRKTSGTRKFQYHPMGSSGVNIEPAEAMKHVTHSQALSQQVAEGLKGQEKGYSQFVGHAPNNAMDMDKVADFQRSMKRSEETPYRGVIPGHGSNTSATLDGPAGFYAPNRTAQTSHNMLELLHKVDQSRDHVTAKQFDPSDHSHSFEMPESEASETFVTHLRRTQSSTSQGFGLRLAPPSQRVPVSSHAFTSQSSSQAVNEHDSRHADPEVAEKGQTWLASTAPVQSLAHSEEMSQREHWDNKTSTSGQAGNENSLSNMQGKSAAFTSARPYSRNQLQCQGGQVPKDHSLNGPFDSRASRLTQTNDSHDRMASDQSAQASLPGTTSRVVPFNLGSPADTSQSVSTSSSYLRVSGQQLPALDSVPVSQPLVKSGISQQGAFSKMLHNVWNNVPSRQRPSSGHPHKVPTSLFPFISPSNNNLETTSWAQKPGDQDAKKGVNSSFEFGTGSVNPQGFPHSEDQIRKESAWRQLPSEKTELAPQTAAASQSQDSVAHQLLDANSVGSSSLLAHRHQQEIDRERNGKDPVVISQTEHTSSQNPPSSYRDIEVLGRSLTPSNVHQNYSLLHQMQAMKGVETDPSKRVLKRLKGPDFGPDGQQVAAMAGQQLLYGYNAMVRDAVENEMNTAARRSPFSSGDTKMLSFSSEVRDDANANVASQDRVTYNRNDSPNHSSNINIPSTRAEHSKISPQMAPSWFKQYGTFKDGQMLPMYDAQRTAKTASQQFFFGKLSDNLPMHTRTEHVNAADATQVSSAWQSTTSTVAVSEHSSLAHSSPPDVTDQSLAVVRPKKRKSAMPELVPWHKEVTQGSQRLHNISVAEQDWAQAANRLIEKVEDDAELIEDAQPLVRPRKRLILTTQLMQQLFRPAPASILSAEVTSNYESVIYFVARLALGDACSLISSLGSGSRVPPDNSNMQSEKVKISGRIGDQYFSKAMEDFIGRARKLENDLLRLDKKVSILDLRVDCQDLERFSVINRFAKFHGRGHADGAETSSSSDASATPQKTCPQRYVTALPLPKNLPEGVQCLSL